ncbi:hypothetical protein SAMN05216298_3099 [Glycomyces sambucus]|uniref:Uncharacterized protein n=1 Tax=Glycomyces sambucus TaxID=380244 RepID=A0A1G9I8R8_9ACTN|nr:hypothetical protein [Glycomyces sambucus]SDL21621.1 hypothetical protein SAMN05216298_3099 [Glycomyces sambucus]
MSDVTAMSDHPADTSTPQGRGLKHALIRRWPTLLAILVSIPGFTDEPTRGLVDSFAVAMLLLPLWYVVIGATGRRNLTWWVLGGAIALFVGLRFQDAVDPSVVLLSISLAAVVWGTIRGRLVEPAFLLQIAGLAVFAALSATALNAADFDTALYAVAAGWFAHGIWDIAHHRANAGVARTGAEWCAVVDVLIAVQLVLMSLLL